MSEHPLRAYRKRIGLTLEVLANLADTSASTLSRIESGLLAPTSPLVVRLSEATQGEVTIEQIVRAAIGAPSGEAA